MDPSSSLNVAEQLQPGTDASLYAAMDSKTPFSATHESLGWWLSPTFYSTLAEEPETDSSENNELQLRKIQIENDIPHPSAEQLANYFRKMEGLGHKKGEWPKNVNDWELMPEKEKESWFTSTLQVVQEVLGL